MKTKIVTILLVISINTTIAVYYKKEVAVPLYDHVMFFTGTQLPGYKIVGHGNYTSLSDECLQGDWHTATHRAEAGIDFPVAIDNENKYHFELPIYIRKNKCNWILTSPSIFLRAKERSLFGEEEYSMVITIGNKFFGNFNKNSLMSSIKDNSALSNIKCEEEGEYGALKTNSDDRNELILNCKTETGVSSENQTLWLFANDWNNTIDKLIIVHFTVNFEK